MGRTVPPIRSRLQKNECDEEKEELEVLLRLLLQIQLVLMQIMFPLLLLPSEI